MAPPERWFEDFVPGQVEEFGDFVMTLAEIIGFAARYDPQPFQIDPEAARASAFGELVASGWNTAAVAMRLMVDHFIPPNAALGSPGVDAVRWVKPVYPGDTLRMRATVIAAKPSSSKPDRGIATMRCEVFNQKDELVMHMQSMQMMGRRPAA